MPIIKRYPNRKLYDTEAKQYITLEGIAELLRSGEEVQVIDYATGEDLSALTLTQIILEQEKKQSGFLPRTFLASLIQTSGSRLNTLQRAVVFFRRQIDDEIKRRVQVLIDQDDLSEDEAGNLLEKLLEAGSIHREEIQSKFGEQDLILDDFERFIKNRWVPTRKDLDELASQLDQLSNQIDEMQRSNSSS